MSDFPRKYRTKIPAAVAVVILFSLSNGLGQVVQEDPEELRGIDVVEHPGDSIPLDLQFIDDAGRQVTLGDYFKEGRPVVLMMGYYTCPMLCNLVMNGIANAAKGIDWMPGEEYQIVSVSIDPTETDVVAGAKKKNYMRDIGRPGAEDGWALLTGPENQSRALADAVGFKYYYDEKQKQYAHAAVLTILSPNGMISRYFYGIEYNPRDLKFSLIDASDGKVGSAMDKLLLYCYHYDPDAGGYVVFAGNIMRLGGAFTLLILAVFIGSLWLRERRRRIRVAGGTVTQGM